MQGKKSLSGASQSVSTVDVSSVFSTYVYTGNGTTQDIVNGIDLATDGGMVWIKARNVAEGHRLLNTDSGSTKLLVSNNTGSQYTIDGGFDSFTSQGFNLKVDNGWRMNKVGDTYASWTFKNADKFFKTTTKVHTTGTASTVDLSNLGTVGMVEVKSTIGTSNWFTYHRSATSGKLLYLNLYDAETTDASISVSGTTLTIAAAMPSDTYVIYAYAHDTSAEGFIQCGSYVGTGLTGNTVNLGWEPQYLLIFSGGAYATILDSMRGVPTGGDSVRLLPGLPDAESVSTGNVVDFTSTGFTLKSNNYNVSTTSNFYMAIRRPMKTPLSSDEVFAIDTRSATSPGFTSDFPVDMGITNTVASPGNTYSASRLTSGKYLFTNATDAEVSQSDYVFDFMDGWKNSTSTNTGDYSWMWKRAKGFFDVVAYTGNGVAGRTVNHNLGVVPEMIWTKVRNATRDWYCHHSFGTTDYGNIKLSQRVSGNTFNYTDNYYMGAVPDDSAFYVSGEPNYDSTNTYIAYLFTTLAGISKVGSYTGNSTSKTIDCGFNTGAKFVIIKRTDSSGDWIMVDATRGLDKFLELNTTNAEATGSGIATDTSGFIVTQNATTDLNASAAEYIYFSIANPI